VPAAVPAVAPVPAAVPALSPVLAAGSLLSDFLSPLSQAPRQAAAMSTEESTLVVFIRARTICTGPTYPVGKKMTLDSDGFERQFQFLAVLVCLCHPANERDIDACIRDGARSVEDIGEMCGAGTGCGACRDDLRERLERAGVDGMSDVPASDLSAPRRGCSQGLVSLRSVKAA
jgi:bacterioferritin-associated ferredoxin